MKSWHKIFIKNLRYYYLIKNLLLKLFIISFLFKLLSITLDIYFGHFPDVYNDIIFTHLINYYFLFFFKPLYIYWIFDCIYIYIYIYIFFFFLSRFGILELKNKVDLKKTKKNANSSTPVFFKNLIQFNEELYNCKKVKELYNFDKKNLNFNINLYKKKF